MSVCGGWSLVNHRGPLTRAITLWCRAWSCPDCNPHRVRKLKNEAAEGHPTTFLTLTVNPAHGQSPEGRARELSDALKIMIKRARRKFTKAPIEYLAVFEETKKGEPHLHVLMRAPFLPQKWISATMDELIKAPIVDIRHVHSKKHAANYVAKYVGKGPRAFGSLKRYWSTPGYVASSRPKRDKGDLWGSGWSIERASLSEIFDWWRNIGYAVEWSGDHSIYAGPRSPPIGVYNIQPWLLQK